MRLILDTRPEYSDRLTVFSTVAITGMKNLPIGSSITIQKDALAQSTPIPVEHWSSIKNLLIGSSITILRDALAQSTPFEEKPYQQ